ncbi:MAG: class I SAM-dependent methyltransferase [Bacillus sp. (in: firmicutes)]
MGREFLPIFEEWAEDYDRTVSGHDVEYEEVFRGYEQILESVAAASAGHVLEFGAGTGNLTVKLLDKGRSVTAIEPSMPMREIAERKIQQGNVVFHEGDFLEFPAVESVDSIVSTYAFHHLTDQEKAVAVKRYGNLLIKGGKIVFADTMYETGEAHQRAISDAEISGFTQLAKDLRTEYYTTIPYLQSLFDDNGFVVSFKPCNRFVWMLEAIKL